MTTIRPAIDEATRRAIALRTESACSAILARSARAISC